MILGEHVEPVYNLCMGLLRTLDSFEALTQLRICSNPVLYILPAKLSQNFPYNDNNIQFSYVLLFRDCISHACFWRLVNTTLFMFTGINPWCCRYLGSVSHCSHKLNISSVASSSLLTDGQIASPGLFFILWPEGMAIIFYFCAFPCFHYLSVCW